MALQNIMHCTNTQEEWIYAHMLAYQKEDCIPEKAISLTESKKL